MTIQELLQATGWTMAQMAKYFNIPYRTIQSWVLGDRKANQYIIDLMEYKLRNEGIIK